MVKSGLVRLTLRICYAYAMRTPKWIFTLRRIKAIRVEVYRERHKDRLHIILNKLFKKDIYSAYQTEMVNKSIMFGVVLQLRSCQGRYRLVTVHTHGNLS